jgi:site-specific DNA recombinase
VYLRISLDRTGHAAGVTRQRDDCERRCRDREWRVAAVESDNDASAARGARRRPGFEAMLQRLEAGEAQVLVAWSLDRLQRSRRDEVRLYEVCQARGVTISLVNGADLDLSTAGGRFTADALSSVARYEIELKSDRQRAAQAQAARSGKRVGGQRPFGYEVDGVTVRDDEAAAIRDGYQAILAGDTLAKIARDWNTRGLTTGQTGVREDRKGIPSPHTRSSVRNILLNPRNAGLRAHNREVVADAVWPPIVDRDTWQAAVGILRNPSRTTPPANARSMLTGIGLCGVCGLTVHSGGAAGGSHGRVYRCRSMKHFARSADAVDQYVGAVVVERLSRPDARGLLTDTRRPDLSKLREQAVALRARMDALALEFADGELTASQLRTASERIKAKLNAIDAELTDARRAEVLNELVESGDAEEVWDRLSTARRRAVVDLLMTVRLHAPGRGTRTFRPETVEVHWRR